MKPIWSGDESMSNHYSTSVLKDGYLYGFDGRQEFGQTLRCVELATGKVMWNVDGFGAGTLLIAGDTLVIMRESGELALAPASPKAFRFNARAQLLKGVVRAYPALANGRYYVRNEHQLSAFDLTEAIDRQMQAVRQNMSIAIRLTAAMAAALTAGPGMTAQTTVDEGPIGPSPYTVVRGWHKPFAAPGFAFGGNSGVFAESPDRIFVAQRGEFRLPTPIPPEFAGFAGSIKMNVLTLADRRVWQNCLYTLDRNGKVKERWTQWDQLCEGSSGPGPHRLRISPYDRERRVWVVNETFHTIYVFSNDGKKLLKTLGEKNVPGNDADALRQAAGCGVPAGRPHSDRRRPRQPSRHDSRRE